MLADTAQNNKDKVYNPHILHLIKNENLIMEIMLYLPTTQ